MSITWSIHSSSPFVPPSISGSVMFSSAVSVGIRLYAWKTKPTCSRRSSVSCLSLSVGEVRLADEDGALGERVEAGEAVQQRRLAGSRRTHDRREAAGFERDRHTVEGVDRGVTDAVDLLGVDRAGGGGGRGRCRGGGGHADGLVRFSPGLPACWPDRGGVGRRRHANALIHDAIMHSLVVAAPCVPYARGLMACPSCARPVPEGARFCPACGHSLAAAHRPRDGGSSPSCSPTWSVSRRSPSSATRSR